MSSDRRRWKRRAQARDALERIFDQENARIVHYSCESFAKLENGRSLRIASIAVKHVKSEIVRSFSIHQHAERLNIPQSEIWDRFGEVETSVLSDFFEYVRTHQGSIWAHWNMRSDNFGFQALEHRARILGLDPPVIAEDHKIDVAQLMNDIYGPGYAALPTDVPNKAGVVLVNLAARNNIASERFLPGAVEAELFDKGEFLRLQQSTHKKVDFISYVAESAADQTLKTNRTMKRIVAWNASMFVDLFRTNKIIQGLLILVSIGGAVVFALKVFGLLPW